MDSSDQDGPRTSLRIGLIGPGRAGSSLARALVAAGYQVTAVAARHLATAQALAAALRSTAVVSEKDVIKECELCFLAVPDAAVAVVAGELVPLGRLDGKGFVHLGGALGLEPLRCLEDAGAETAVFHPLQTFSRSATSYLNLRGSVIGIDGTGALRDRLWQIALDLGTQPVSLVGVNRVGYHAAAVLVASYSVTLLAEGVRLMTAAGVEPALASAGLLALLRGVVRNLETSSPRDAITGPASRGDQQTIDRHLAALGEEPQLREIYRLLADRTMRLVKETA